jgi:hypothetical protein
MINLYQLKDGESYSKSAIASDLYPDWSCDSSLPQQWLDRITELLGEEAYNRAYFGLVWGYGKSDIMGRPLPVTMDGLKLLADLAACAGFRRA